MSYPHRIRLRGPWECQPLARSGAAPLPSPLRMTLPCRWSQGGLHDFAGRVRFCRRFGFPGRIDAFERVWLICAGLETSADVWLNGQLLGRVEGSFAFDVTQLLRIRDELIVEVEGPADRGGIWGEVALEVRCTAYLQNIEVRPEIEGTTARLHVGGAVFGSAERPLDLYVLLDGSTIAYTTIEPAPDGRPFQLVSEAIEPERWHSESPQMVRVDLVNAASLWYQFEQSVSFPRSERPPRGGE